MRTITDKIRIAPCLWFDKNAEEAAKFYAATFPNSRVTAVHEAPGDYPGGKAGDVLTVEFTVLGQHFVGLNGGPEFTFDEAVSFQVFTDTQEETDRYWNVPARRLRCGFFFQATRLQRGCCERCPPLATATAAMATHSALP
jgi:predicted 3-demethylubiquinone-9 3-methyltransferase (glyoxalase superfamily)